MYQLQYAVDHIPGKMHSRSWPHPSYSHSSYVEKIWSENWKSNLKMKAYFSCYCQTLQICLESSTTYPKKQAQSMRQEYIKYEITPTNQNDHFFSQITVVGYRTVFCGGTRF